jgi:type III restriction enzyme
VEKRGLVQPVTFLDEWVKAVNEHGGFGKWQWDVSKNPSDIAEILQKASTFSIPHF